MKLPGEYVLSLPGKCVISLLFAAASIGAVVRAEEAEAQRRPTPSPVEVPALSQRQLGPDTGACCVANAMDTCESGKTRAECEDLGGYYAGDGSNCDFTIGPFNICDVGSCCIGIGADADECKEVSATQCRASNFVSFVPGGKCLEDTCLFGACCTQLAGGCFSDSYKGRCEDVTFDWGLNGTFLGNGTECGGEEDICQCRDGNEDVCSTLDLPCGQECNYDFQCDSGCCLTRGQLKFRKPNDPRCPNDFPPMPGESCNLTDVTCSYFWCCPCGECKYATDGCTCQNGMWDCPDPTSCDAFECPQPVGQCTESEWCKCADQVQGEGGQLRDFLHCVKECPMKQIK